MSGNLSTMAMQSNFMAALLGAVKNPNCCDTCRNLASVAEDFIKAGGKAKLSKKSKGV